MSDEFIATWRKTLAERPDGTHYDGCHLSHPPCALSFATDEIVRLRAVLDAIDAHVRRSIDGEPRSEYEAGYDEACMDVLAILRPMTVDEAINTLGTVHK